MTNYSNKTLDFLRNITAGFNSRPAGVLLFYNQDYNELNTYSVTVGSSTIVLSNGTTSYTVTYSNKSSKQVAIELSNSPFLIKVVPILDVKSIGPSELKSSGSVLASGFDIEDRTTDGRGAIVRITRYVASYSKVSAIGVAAPYPNDSLMPWWARITIGSFSQLYKGIVYHFGVPEWKNQTWSLNFGQPFVDVEGESANFLNKTTIQLSRKNILYKNNIFLYSAGGTTSIQNAIKFVDTINGIVYLNEGLSLPKDLLVDYTYYENSYQYKYLDLNGHFSRNPYVLDKYVVFYLLPHKASNGYERLRTVFHSIGSSIEDAVYKIDTENALEPIAILGAINIRPYFNNSSVSVTDTRSFGGGLRDDEVGQIAERKFKESQYFFDITRKEGIPYPGAASVVVDIPKYLKEVLSIAEIRDKIYKNIAAGVYPIIRFQDSEVSEQLIATDYNSDISLLDYSLSGHNTGQSYFGQSGYAACVLPTFIDMPSSGIYYTGYYDQISYDAPVNLNGIVSLTPGSVYKVPILHGISDATFTWEERSKDSEWKPVTYNIESHLGVISTKFIPLDASYGYKEIRNFTGLSSYINNPELYSDLALEIARTHYLSTGLMSSSLNCQTGEYTDVFSSTISSKTGLIGCPEFLRPLVENYNVCLDKNLLSGNSLITGSSKFIFDATSGNTFPKVFNGTSVSDVYTGIYNAMTDINTYASYAKHRINQVVEEQPTYQPIYLTGTLPYISDKDIGYALSGAIAITRKALSLDPFAPIGTITTDIVTPFYSPSGNSKVDLSTSTFTDVSPSNNIHLGPQYIKALSSVYAALPCHMSGLATGGLFINGNFDPKNIALSGIGYWTTFFNNYYLASRSGDILPLSWLTTYNKISDLLSSVSVNICDAIDNLYYGNNAWAGWTGFTKSGTYYDATYNNNINYQYDRSWTGNISWPDLTVNNGTDTLTKAISGICTIQNNAIPIIRAQCELGGILPPGYPSAIKKYLWYPIHNAKEDTLFTGLSFDTQTFVDTFEIGAGAVIKGSLNSDGIIFEGGSFQYAPAPFSGTVPSELFDVCSEAIKYYTLIDNDVQKRKWESIADGILKATVSGYAQEYGYPFSQFFTGSAAGDPGSVPLNGWIKLINNYSGSFTNEENMFFTGEAPNLR